MDVLASGRRFSIPTCSHIVYVAWGSMGRGGMQQKVRTDSSLFVIFLFKQVERVVSRSGVWLWNVLVLSRLTHQTCSMDQQQTRDATNVARGWFYAEICDVSERTCVNERQFYASLRLRRRIQWRFLTFITNWIIALRRGGCDVSIVPLVVRVRRVVVEKWSYQCVQISRMTLEISNLPPQTT